jgi:hypothetical protein
MRTRQELRQLAIDTLSGQVFWDWHLTESEQKNQAGMIFMPLIFMKPKEAAKLKRTAFHVYEYLDKALPRSINGRPIFASMCYVNKEEWAIVVEIMTELKGAIAAVK